MEVSILNKIKVYLLWFVANLIAYLFYGYGWRGFLPRVIFAILAYKLSRWGLTPEHSSGLGTDKLALFAIGIFVYAVYKLIYDYTKAGKETEAKKRNEDEQSG